MDKEVYSGVSWHELWGFIHGHLKPLKQNPSCEAKHEVIIIGEKMHVKRPEHIDDLIIQHLANALAQINQLIKKRENENNPMNILEKVGCFCTFLRTSMHSQEVSTDFYRVATKLSQPKMWSNVGVPQYYRFEWGQVIETESGTWKISRDRLLNLIDIAKELSEYKEQMGIAMPIQPSLATSSRDKEPRGVVMSTEPVYNRVTAAGTSTPRPTVIEGSVVIKEPEPEDSIMQSFLAMKALIANAEETNKKARRLNYEADRVMSSLTEVAENLASRIPA